MIKAIIFDLDGTLLNRDASVREFINHQYERLHPWLEFISKESYTSRFLEIENHGYVWKDKVYQQIIAEFNIKGITKEKLLNDYLNHFKFHCVPFQNLIAMLEDLKKNKLDLAIISNGKGQFQMDSIEALGIKNYFKEILISEWEGLSKPDPRIFIRALTKLNTLPGETIFVGDHPLYDMKAAKDVGMKVIWKKSELWSAADADFIVDDLSEIAVILEHLNKVKG